MRSFARYSSAPLLAFMLLTAACGGNDDNDGSTATPTTLPSLAVTSSAFAADGAIPETYTCEGDNVNPPLAWTAPPADTVELAVVVDDPDAPRGTFTHWVVYRIPPTTREIVESKLPVGLAQGQTSAGAVEYTGMCPPDGETHHYRFRVYALDGQPAITDDTTPDDAVAAIEAAAIARGELVATFSR